MTYTMNIPADYNKVIADATQLGLYTDYASGEDIGFMYTLDNFAADAQFRLLYEFLVAAHVRAKLHHADRDGDTIFSKVTKAHWLGEKSYAEVEFRTKKDAMLFKLAYRGEA